MQRRTIAVLQVLLALLAWGVLLLQAAYVPIMAMDSAARFPEVGFLAVPFAVLAIAALTCVQVALWCVSRLLSTVRQGEIFTAEKAFRYVDGISWSAGVASAITLAMHQWLAQVGVQHISLTLGLVGAAVGGLALILLMTVMKALLRAATRLQADLAEVI